MLYTDSVEMNIFLEIVYCIFVVLGFKRALYKIEM